MTKRGLLIALMTAGIGASIALTTGVLLKDDARAAGSAIVKGERLAHLRSVAGAQPDTSSPHWNELSDDVGVMIRDDERLGLRGRLYVRVEGVWLPVGTDGPGDVRGTVPAN